MSTATDAARPLTDVYHDWVKVTIDEKGVELPHGLILDKEGKLTVCALALDPPEAYAFMLAQWVTSSPREMIFALDRYALPGQGTTYGDLLAGWHLIGTDGDSREIKSRPFTIEYQHEPRVVQPYDWNNAWWNAGLARELEGAMRSIIARPRNMRAANR